MFRKFLTHLAKPEDTFVLDETSKEKTPIFTETKKSSVADQQNGFVQVWKSKAGSVGHVAIQQGGTKPKRLKKQQGDYNSLWPTGLPAFGPLAVFPLRAGLAKTLRADEKREAVTHDSSTADD